MAVSRNEDNYIVWDDTVEGRCVNVQWRERESIKLCRADPVMHLNKPPKCLLANADADSEDVCATKMIKTPETWMVGLTDPNKWMVVTNGKTTIRPVCRTLRNARPATIQGSGILKITEPCNVVVGGTELMFIRQIETREKQIETTVVRNELPQMPHWDKQWLADRKETPKKIDKIRGD
ncbi:hypothetical protein HA402_015926 [Bradysia odoriphaga]|nr:hypothetical protein HA402_015926 [Bradysia odoriphaga]